MLNRLERLVLLDIVNKKPEIINNTKELYNKIYDPSIPKYILGINYLSDRIIDSFAKENINLQGIIDDYSDETKYRNIKIFKLSDVSKDSLVISCVVDGRLQTAMENIDSNSILYKLNYFELCLHNSELFDYPQFCENNLADIDTHGKEYEWLYGILDDDKSREILNCLIDLRYNFNINATKHFELNLDLQYYDDFIKFGSNEVFVDCGGFDGTSSLEFIKRNPEYKKVFFFEPTSKYYYLAKERFKSSRNIMLFNNAVYEKNCTLTFDSTKGSASGLSINGDVLVRAIKLDDIINEYITYMKFDVEGAEYSTILGAETLIKKYKPKLAVCVYHNQEDFWRIPKLVLKYNPEYKVYLRHYTEGLLETVMYFI